MRRLWSRATSLRWRWWLVANSALSTLERVKNVIGSELALSVQVNDADRIKDDLGADSLDLVELVMAIEDEFVIDIDDDEIGDNFDTALSIAVFVDKVVACGK